MIGDSEIVNILQSIRELLRKHDHPYQVSVVEDIINGGGEYDLFGNDVWGGSGSVVDCSMISGPPDVESLRDQREFFILQNKLADQLVKNGKASTLVKQRRAAAILSVESLNDKYPQINF